MPKAIFNIFNNSFPHKENEVVGVQSAENNFDFDIWANIFSALKQRGESSWQLDFAWLIFGL